MHYRDGEHATESLCSFAKQQNKCSFLSANVENYGDDLTHLGSLLQNEEPAMMKAHSTNFMQYLGTANCAFRQS